MIVLAIYATVLRPASPHDTVDRRWPRRNAGRPPVGKPTTPGDMRTRLAPTLELTRALPNQHVYEQRLALIYQHLGRAVDEAAAWERMVAVLADS